MPWRPSEPGERPSLGGAVLKWIEYYLLVVDGPSVGDPLRFTEEQVQFVLRLYELDPEFRGGAIDGRAINNGRLIRRAILSRPKGWGKSPIGAALCIVEALGPVVFDGWDADGQPVGIGWADTGVKPKVQIVAVSEDQTANTWEPCLDMVRSSDALLEDYDVAPMEGFITVPRGRIEAATSAGIPPLADASTASMVASADPGGGVGTGSSVGSASGSSVAAARMTRSNSASLLST